MLTFPHQARFWLLRNPELFNEVISVVVDTPLVHLMTSELGRFEEPMVPHSPPFQILTNGTVLKCFIRADVKLQHWVR